MDASPKECKMTALESNRILECKTFIMKLSMCPFKQKAVSEWARVGQLDKCRSIQELVPLCKRVWAKASTLYPCNTKHFPCQSSVGFSVGLFNFIFPETSLLELQSHTGNFLALWAWHVDLQHNYVTYWATTRKPRRRNSVHQPF